jgi:hypothetical protein
METRSTSTSSHPRRPSPTPTPTPTLAERRRLQQFNGTQLISTSSISSESSQAVGTGRNTSFPGREPVRLFETEDEQENASEYEADERGRVLGVFEVDVSITHLPKFMYFRFHFFSYSIYFHKLSSSRKRQFIATSHVPYQKSNPHVNRSTWLTNRSLNIRRPTTTASATVLTGTRLIRGFAIHSNTSFYYLRQLTLAVRKESQHQSPSPFKPTSSSTAGGTTRIKMENMRCQTTMRRLFD